jgi:hypothetical protein
MRNNVGKIWGTNIQSCNKIVTAKVSKSIVKEQIDSKIWSKTIDWGTKIYGPWKRTCLTKNKATAKEQLRI